MTFRDIFTNYATSLRNRSYELCIELVPICRDITKSNPKKTFASYIAFLLYTLPLKSLTTEVIDEILLSKRQYAEALLKSFSKLTSIPNYDQYLDMMKELVLIHQELERILPDMLKYRIELIPFQITKTSYYDIMKIIWTMYENQYLQKPLSVYGSEFMYWLTAYFDQRYDIQSKARDIINIQNCIPQFNTRPTLEEQQFNILIRNMCRRIDEEIIHGVKKMFPYKL